MKRNILTILFYVCLFSIVTATASQARDVTLQWDASTDTSITGYKVNYNADSATTPFSGTGAVQGASPYNVNKVTTATLTGLDAGRAYYFAVTAYNAAGTQSAYSNIVSVAEATPPTVSITAPATNSTISGTVSVTASASDNVGVSKVEFYLNGVLKTTDTSTPYLYSLNTATLTSGTYTLMAKAYDAAGNVGQSSTVSVSVVNDTTAPIVSLTSPANNATVSGTTTMVASASDNVGVSKVEFYRSGTLLYATNVAPFSYAWNTTTVTNGSYTMTAKAYDNTGNVTTSANVLVTVSNVVADVTAPTVSLTAPVNGAIVSGTVTVAATASDDVGVSKVEFYLNNVLTATDTATPFTYSWNTATVANGTYSLMAKAYDAAGNTTSSSAASVTVKNSVVDITAPTVVTFSMPTTSTTLQVPITAFSGNDNVGVASYCVTTTNATTYCDWLASPNTSFTFSSAGTKTAYAWVKDAAGNVSASKSSVITVTLPVSVNYSLWSTSAVPVVKGSTDTKAVELGVKFRSDVTGTITGIRFYKASTNTGTHVAHLWSSAGALLATATFSSETASGWQQVNFSTPVAIAANTVYVASYHTNTGHYSFDNNYFATKGVDNAPLHALANGVSGANSVYAYGTTSTFPSQSYLSTNYWVDVVFRK